MPYQTQDYTPPPLPNFLPPKTFVDLRTAISRIEDYLQQLRSTDVSYFQQLQTNMNQNASLQGPDIAAAATITPTAYMHVVTGSATITTINVPLNFQGALILVAQDGFTLSVGGNISLPTGALNVQIGTYVQLVWVPSENTWHGPRA